MENGRAARSGLAADAAGEGSAPGPRELIGKLLLKCEVLPGAVSAPTLGASPWI